MAATIKFLCPNGHPLSAPENLAGKAGKCPKCGLAFVVPTLEELNAAAEETPPEPEPEPEFAPPEEEPAAEEMPAEDQPPQSPIEGGSAKPSPEIFVFLCPNGHKLNGPPSLKGKAGQCPHCGAKFRIPSDDDLEEPPLDPELEPEEIPEEAPAEEEYLPPPDAEAEEEPEVEPEVEVYVDPPPEIGHALGYVFARLWDQREADSDVELFLKEGEIFAPDFYCDNLSCREYGVFAVEDSDGKFQFTVIPWDDVRKIHVRKISKLPQPMFR